MQTAAGLMRTSTMKPLNTVVFLKRASEQENLEPHSALFG
jgi:hypothetical protein